MIGLYGSKYKAFFGTSPANMCLSDNFDEDAKNGVCKLLKENIQITTVKEWDKFIKKYKDNEDVKVAALRSNGVAFSIKMDIINKELKKDKKSNKILIEALNRPLEIESLVLEIVASLSEMSLIINEYKKAFKDERKPNISAQVTEILNKHLWRELNGSSLLHYHIDDKCLTNIRASARMQGKAPDENVVLGIINNQNLTNKERDKWFDEFECDIAKIKNPTPHMVREIYKSCVETMFDVPYKELFDGNTRDKELNRIKDIIISFIEDDKLRPDAQRDLLYRLMSVTETEKRKYISKIEDALAIYSEEPYILETLSSMNTHTFANQFLPQAVAEKKARDITDILCKKTTYDSTKEKGAIIGLYGKYLDFGEENCKKIIENNTMEVYGVFSEHYKTPNKILEQIINSGNSVSDLDINTIYLFRAFFMLELKKCGFSSEKAEFLVSKLPLSSSFMITKNEGNDCIDLNIFETKKVLDILKKGQKTYPNTFIFTMYMNNLKNAHMGRDIRIDFPHCFYNSFEINQNKEKEKWVLKKDFDKKRFLKCKSLYSGVFLYMEMDLYNMLNETKDRVKFYEIIDDVIDTVNEIRKIATKHKNKEILQDIISI